MQKKMEILAAEYDAKRRKKARANPVSLIAKSPVRRQRDLLLLEKYLADKKRQEELDAKSARKRLKGDEHSSGSSVSGSDRSSSSSQASIKYKNSTSQSTARARGRPRAMPLPNSDKLSGYLMKKGLKMAKNSANIVQQNSRSEKHKSPSGNSSSVMSHQGRERPRLRVTPAVTVETNPKANSKTTVKCGKDHSGKLDKQKVTSDPVVAHSSRRSSPRSTVAVAAPGMHSNIKKSPAFVSRMLKELK